MAGLDEPGESVEELEQQMQAAEETVEEPAEEPQAEVEPEAAKEERTNVVPVDTITAARSENRALKQELEQLRQSLNELTPIRDQLNEQRLQAQKQQESQRFETDPLGALNERLARMEEQQGQQVQAVTQQQQEAQAKAGLERQMAIAVQSFAQEQPDYTDALQHVVQTRAQQLRIQGVPETNISEMVEAESYALAQQHGANAPRVVYEYAKTLGYAPKQEKQSNLAKVERGQKAAQTLSDSRGSAAKESPSVTDIEKMSDEEFDKWSSKHWQEMREEESRG